MKANIDQTVREIAIRTRGAFKRANVPLDEVLQRLSAVDDQPAESDGNWIEANISDLLGHIVQKHHGYIRSESPRLVSLFQKVQMRHGVARPELKSIQQLFAAMAESF